MSGYHLGRTLTKEYCQGVCARHTTRDSLHSSDSSVYRKCKVNGWLDIFLPATRRPNFTKELCQEVASQFSSRSDLEVGDNTVYQKCVREGWLQEFFGDPLTRPFTEQEIREEASLYQTRVAFKRGSPGQYSAATKAGLMDELIPHRQLRDLTYGFCKQELSKYSSSTEVRKKDESLWEKSIKLGLFEELGMESLGSVGDNDCIYLIKTPLKVEGSSVYKVGVTSSRLGDDRVRRVISSSGLNSELVLLAAVDCKATDLEKHFLGSGVIVTFDDAFDGYTEYRSFTKEEVRYIMNTIKQNMGRV